MPLCEAIRQKNLRATGMNSGGGSNDFAEATAQQVKEVANWLALKIYSDAWEVEALRAKMKVAPERVEACTHKLRTLSKLLSWWDSLGGVEQSSIANINKLVNMGELLCSAALPTGTLARTGDGGDDDKGEGRRKAKES